MKQFFIAFLIIIINFQADSCTTFSFGETTGHFVSKSYDWSLGHGMVAINKRNMKKVALRLDKNDTPAEWSSKYGSATFAQFGKEFPLGGINEKSLVVEIMWLNISAYPDFTEDSRPAINELQWIQFILDQAQTTSEAIQLAQTVRINSAFANVHYMVCDKSGACATFEYIDKKLVITDNNNIVAKVLTNNTHEKSLSFLQKHVGFGGDKSIQFGSTTSLDRYVIGAYQSMNFSSSKNQPIDYGFAGLKSVSQGDYSKWNIVYDQELQQVHFRTLKQKAIKTFSLKSFNFSCKKPVQVINMNDFKNNGSVDSKFIDSTLEFNKNIIDSNTFVDEDLKALALNYPEANTTCLEL